MFSEAWACFLPDHHDAVVDQICLDTRHCTLLMLSAITFWPNRNARAVTYLSWVESVGGPLYPPLYPEFAHCWLVVIIAVSVRETRRVRPCRILTRSELRRVAH